MFGNGEFDQIERFKAGMSGNPMENSHEGFQERLRQGPTIGLKFEQAMNGYGPYQNITENTPAGFQQRRQLFHDKLMADFKPFKPLPEPIKNEFRLDIPEIDPLPKYAPPKLDIEPLPKYEPPVFDLYKKPWEK